MILAVLQARLSSTRLPGKVLKPIFGEAMLAHQIHRILRSKHIDKLIVATSTEKEDAAIEELCVNLDVGCFHGSLHDVLDRFYQAATMYSPSHIVRLTGDCPLTDPSVIDRTIQKHLAKEFDYTTNCLPPTFPDGLDVEVIRFSALKSAWENACLPSQREHVTPYIWENPDLFRIGNLANDKDLSMHRWTVDEPEDYELVLKIYEALYSGNPCFGMSDIMKLLEKHPDLVDWNRHIKRNEGLKKSIRSDEKYINERVNNE